MHGLPVWPRDEPHCDLFLCGFKLAKKELYLEQLEVPLAATCLVMVHHTVQRETGTTKGCPTLYPRLSSVKRS